VLSLLNHVTTSLTTVSAFLPSLEATDTSLGEEAGPVPSGRTPVSRINTCAAPSHQGLGPEYHSGQ
jgi:hypothetical protein